MEVWKIPRQIKGKHTSQCKPPQALGFLITDRGAVADLLASTIEASSSSACRSALFLKDRTLKENGPYTCSSSNAETYYLPFSITELKSALLACNEPFPGLYEVHYQLLKHLPESCLEALLKVS
eukprot:TRINITY_DN73672_c0_g1_i2.p1 TRINITY_DN73672_c0_g1~~TRINITY_DN73672_c0_g1_i2.p1  ORF type:complete len:124 (+),score=13.25 TRINITY_DN73672_c0_g1_i2:72-443(+)